MTSESDRESNKLPDELLNKLQECVDGGKKDLLQTLDINLKNKKIIRFKLESNSNINLYAVYNPFATTLNGLINSLFENYECASAKREEFIIYSEQLKR